MSMQAVLVIKKSRGLLGVVGYKDEFGEWKQKGLLTSSHASSLPPAGFVAGAARELESSIYRACSLSIKLAVTANVEMYRKSLCASTRTWKGAA